MANVHPGLKKILFKRFLYITLWHVCIQTLILQFIASVNFSERPLLWLVKWLKNVVNPRFLGVALFQSFLSLNFILTESIQYLKIMPYENITRIRYLMIRFGPNNVIWFFVYFLRGILMVIVFFVALKDYFVYPVDESSSPTNNAVTESTIILISNSICINVLFFLNDFTYQKPFKYFSLIQHNCAPTVPTILLTTKNVSTRSIYYCFIFIVFYFFGGSFFCNYLCRLFSVSADISYLTILSPFVLYCLWLLNFYFLFNILTLKLLYNVYLMSQVKLPIVADSRVQRSESFALKNVLATHNVPLLQYLGYYDLYIVSHFDQNRRKEIFTLSYPGGHPHTWRELSHEAMKLITDTTKQLEEITSQKSSIKDSPERNYGPAQRNYRDMRPLSPSNSNPEKQTEGDCVVVSNIKRMTEYAFNWFINFIMSFTIVAKIVAFFLRIIAYFLEELTDKQLEAVLQRYQSVSLACLSLANLAAISIREDKYGVIQQDLSVIIHTLLRLYVTLNKLVNVDKKPNVSTLQVKKHLNTVVKSSLYKISINFGSYVKDLYLSPEDQRLFESFILFRN